MQSGSVMAATSHWSADDVARLDGRPVPELPLISAHDADPALPGLQLWDSWPIQRADGIAVQFDGWTPWVVMSAPRAIHPDLRHDVARLRLMLERGGVWRDCGNLLPDGLNPGSREWAGSTVCDPASGEVVLFFTATGERGDTDRTFKQRLFQTRGRLIAADGTVRIEGWTAPVESVASDGEHYCVADEHVGVPGFIKAFRDPYHFRDPADGRDYLLFSGSLNRAASDYNGVVGIAVATAPGLGGWALLPPLISADGVNNELERPVMRHIAGRYYIFWSTQRRTFAPGGPAGPNGLYGMVADTLFGPYKPLNGTGLVAANPAAEPFQAYSWWVMDTLEVAGFVDHWGLAGRSLADDPALVRTQFGGTPAPRFRIALDGESAHIVAR